MTGRVLSQRPASVTPLRPMLAPKATLQLRARAWAGRATAGPVFEEATMGEHERCQAETAFCEESY